MDKDAYKKAVYDDCLKILIAAPYTEINKMPSFIPGLLRNIFILLMGENEHAVSEDLTLKWFKNNQALFKSKVTKVHQSQEGKSVLCRRFVKCG